MEFFSVLMLSVGLAMDATAVAAARGFAAETLRVSDFLKIGVLFGGFQAAMPVVGILLGRELGSFVALWDHWIAFSLLSGIGVKMLMDAYSNSRREGGDELGGELFQIRALVVLAVATSVDALAAGLTLPMLDVPMALAVGTIGLVTAALSMLGLFAGRRLGAYIGPRLEVAGGAILILLGVKTLLEHLWADS